MEVTAKKTILKNKEGEYLLPYSIAVEAADTIKLSNYYTKEETDGLLSSSTEDVSEVISTIQDNINTIENNLAGSQSEIGEIQNIIEGMQESLSEAANRDLSNLTDEGQAVLDNKADVSKLSEYLPLTGGSISGDLYCPTVESVDDSSTKAATTEFVQNAITNKITATNGVAFIAETYYSGADTDACSWYRIWSDGWVEQGGYYHYSSTSSNPTHTLTPLIAFDLDKMTPFISVTPQPTSSSDMNNDYGTINARVLTTNGNIQFGWASGALRFRWAAYGYKA